MFLQRGTLSGSTTVARGHHRYLSAALACWLFAAQLQSAMAQTSAEQAEPAAESTIRTLEPVVIEEIRFPATVNFPKLALGIAAFEVNRKLAPEAKLSFRIVDLTVNSTPLKVRWESGDKSTPIEPNSDGNLMLQDPSALGDKEAALVMNRRIDEVRMEPEVLSPGMSQMIHRMGDLRLLCEVTWAIKKAESSAGTRALQWFLGSPCTGKRAVLTMNSAPNTRVLDLEITQGQRTLNLPPNATRTGVNVPIHDRSWGDDAVIRINLEKQIPPPPTEAQAGL